MLTFLGYPTLWSIDRMKPVCLPLHHSYVTPSDNLFQLPGLFKGGLVVAMSPHLYFGSLPFIQSFILALQVIYSPDFLISPYVCDFNFLCTSI